MNVLFIDFEASGFAKKSWPIEIGVAWIARKTIRVESSLIKPSKSWPLSAWSSKSAAVHRIAISDLQTAEDAEFIARRFAELIGTTPILSDSPEFDQMWLDRLMSVHPMPPSIALCDFHAMAQRTFTREILVAVYSELYGRPAVHRAGPDAATLAKAWLAGIGLSRS